MREECIFLFYHRSAENMCDDNMLETCLKSLRRHSDCEIMIMTANLPLEKQEWFSNKYRIYWTNVPIEMVHGRRATSKVEVLEQFVAKLPDGSRVFMSDVDMYFLGDPFMAFKEQDFDIAFTTRGYDYYFPINGGACFINVNEDTRNFLKWQVNECRFPRWETYRLINRRHRKRFGLDWAAGQDFMIACWQQKSWVKTNKNVTIKDAGPRYNYCPPSDKWHGKAFECIRQAYRNRSHVVLHLKGALKKILYEDIFEDGVTTHERLGK